MRFFPSLKKTKTKNTIIKRMILTHKFYVLAFHGSMGSVNLGADAPFMGGAPGGHGPSPADLMAAQQRGSTASPSCDGVLNLPPLTPDNYGR